MRGISQLYSSGVVLAQPPVVCYFQKIVLRSSGYRFEGRRVRNRRIVYDKNNILKNRKEFPLQKNKSGRNQLPIPLSALGTRGSIPHFEEGPDTTSRCCTFPTKEKQSTCYLHLYTCLCINPIHRRLVLI